MMCVQHQHDIDLLITCCITASLNLFPTAGPHPEPWKCPVGLNRLNLIVTGHFTDTVFGWRAVSHSLELSITL